MAEAVLFNVADEIIAKLGSQVLKEIKLWWGVKDELDKLNRTVSSIKAVLLHAEQRSMESTQVKNWVGMLSEAMYDADDLLDEFSTDALRQQLMSGSKMINEVRLFFSSSNQFAYGLKMAHKIKALRDRLDEIAADRRFHLEERAREAPITTRLGRETHSSPPEVVVGRDHDKEAILEILLSSNCDENVSVVPIVGVGGLGKTTLAQLIYNDQQVKMHFELRLWTCVSDDFNVKSIVEKIVESATNKKHKNWGMDALKNLLCEEINMKKFLLVLDDVWNEENNKWFDLKDLLVIGAKGSKILLTTRLRKAAEITRPILIHELKRLPEMESWSLFKQMAFKGGCVPGPSYEAIGKEIVAKCMGVPLVLKTLGGLLYFKSSESDWLSFRNKELLKIKEYKNDISSILKLSYHHLPSHYKHCFAYCSLYPKDYAIDVNDLIHGWIAQGYVKSLDDDECLKHEGLGYLMDLYWMSFFQEVERDVFGNITTCKMHDFMHDLAILVGGENLAMSYFEMSSIQEKTRHITFALDGDSILQALPSLLKAKKLRTLIPYVQNEIHISEEECHAIFLKLRALRVLDLSFLGIKTLPGSIRKLKHLRFLDLSLNPLVRTLPDSVTKLNNLKVLKLRGLRLDRLPKDIKKLVNLTHLDNQDCKLTHMPRGIGQLSHLEELPEFIIAKDNSVSKHSGGLDELHGLNNLRGELTIKNLRHVRNVAFESKAGNLKEKQHLQKLSLWWNENPYPDHNDETDNGANDIDNDEMAVEELQPQQNLKGLTLSCYRGGKYPSWLPSLTKLVTIRIEHCRNIEYLPPFDHLPCLKNLWIFGLINLKWIELSDGGSASFFPVLTDFRVTGCHILKGFMMPSSSSSSPMVELPCFPCLTKLEFGFCPNLTCMPRFPMLEELELREEGGIKSLKNMLMTSVPSFNSSSPFSALSQLKRLIIVQIKDFAAELLQSLTSLKALWFFFCTMKILSSDDKDDCMEWQGLKRLGTFGVVDMPNLESLPKGLQYATTLQWIEIRKCPNLRCLPEWMCSLSELQRLDIKECPKLSERCNNNMAEDWHNISHIPNISIDYQSIQRNGRYLL